MSTEIETKASEENISPEELDALLGIPEAANMSTDNDEPQKKNNVFSKDEVNLDFIDDELTDEDGKLIVAEEETEEEIESKKKAAAKKAEEELKGILDDDEEEEDEEELEKNKGGRPKLDKTGMAQLAESLIADELLIPFEDDKPLSEYTLDDYKELFKSNIDYREQQLREQTPKEFFEALPQELQYAARYVAEGGRDLKGLFRALAVSEETKSLDITHESGQEETVRQYLSARNFGTPEEIQEEIENWKDLGKLAEKAEKFKPRLDEMQEQVIQSKIAQQEKQREKQQIAAKQYADNIYNTVSKEELGGIKLNDKVRKMLYNGLVQPTHSSASGNATNLFGHLIEKHQYLEPNHEIIAQALWLMADPDGFKEEIRRAAKNEEAADTVKKLKLEQQSSKQSSSQEEVRSDRRSKGLPRNAGGGFFKR